MIASKNRRAALLGLVLTLAAANALAYTGQKLASEAKISIEQAQAIALKAHPGKIADEELEREKGGSALRYSFDIRRGSVTQEVGVDAKT
ncbi:MAG TPA: PepSY domain-containing protein, partial [Stenotrophobium sp.]|nr:PepSY domain-containing protein [Stenotrophobium sp.]